VAKIVLESISGASTSGLAGLRGGGLSRATTD